MKLVDLCYLIEFQFTVLVNSDCNWVIETDAELDEEGGESITASGATLYMAMYDLCSKIVGRKIYYRGKSYKIPSELITGETS